MIKTFAFLIDNLEVQLSIWKSNFILEMAKTISQRLEYFPYTYSQKRKYGYSNWLKIQYKQIFCQLKCSDMFLESKGTISNALEYSLLFPKINEIRFPKYQSGRQKFRSYFKCVAIKLLNTLIFSALCFSTKIYSQTSI